MSTAKSIISTVKNKAENDIEILKLSIDISKFIQTQASASTEYDYDHLGKGETDNIHFLNVIDSVYSRLSRTLKIKSPNKTIIDTVVDTARNNH